MQQDAICRTIRQYNKQPIAEEDMAKLLEIAVDYSKVKNCVYQRYGGISGLPKLYPGYTVQNEMTAIGLKEALRLPSVYFYLAVFDALGDIKASWSRIKQETLERIKENPGFTPEERHYLRYVLKVSPCLEKVLLGKEVTLDENFQKEYDRISNGLETKRLDSYLRRQVRRRKKKLHTEKVNMFTASERAYRYADGGIYLSVKEKRKRVFIELTDHNRYDRQIQIRLFPEEKRAELLIPVNISVKKHREYCGETGIAFGFYTMLTTCEGHSYGERLGEYVSKEADWMREQTRIYRKNRRDNPGRKKYRENHRKKEAALHTYINQELNRFLRIEKPAVVYLPKLPQNVSFGMSKAFNYALTLWPRGYIRSRLTQKCREHSVAVVEVTGKEIGRICSGCGEYGTKKDTFFFCPKCGLQLEERSNAARNALRRGREQDNRTTAGTNSRMF